MEKLLKGLDDGLEMEIEFEKKLMTIEDECIRQAIVVNIIDTIAADCGMTSKEWMEMIIPIVESADKVCGRIGG